MEKTDNQVNMELEDFKKLIADLVRYKEDPELDAETKRAIQDLSSTLRYQLEFDLMQKLVTESSSLKETEELLKNMIDKVSLYKSLLLDEHTKSGSTEMNIRVKIKLRALNNSLERLNLLNETVKNRNFNSYVIAMNKRVSSTKQLISIIKRVLSDGYDSYFSAKLIKDDVVDENLMTIIYSIIKNKKLFDELKDYIDEENKIEQMKATNEKDKKCYETLKNSVNYATFFKRFVVISAKLEDFEETEKELKSSLGDDYAEREEMMNQVYSKALYKAPLRKLERSIYEKEEQLRKINLQRKELETAEQKLKNAGFGDILDAFQTKILLANDVYEKFAIYIKSKVNSDTLDIETFLKSFENRISMTEIQIDRMSRKLDASLEMKYPLARRLILHYHDDTKKIVDLFSSDDDMSKMVAFYVLDLLCSSKKIDINELRDVYPYSKELQEITTKMEERLSNDIHQINEEAAKVENDADRVMRVS